jgi:tetratricopeptide (TPR) repeat protein
VLCGFFFMLSLWAYARYVRSEGKRRRAGSYLLLLAAFSLALMAKPMAVTLPFVLLLLDYWPLNTSWSARQKAFPWWTLVREKIPLFLLSAISIVITALAQRVGGAILSAEQIPLTVRLANAALAYIGYIGMTVWPRHLAVFYPFPSDLLASWKPVAAALALIVLSWAAWKWRQTNRFLWVGWLWFLATLVPVIGLVQVGEQAMADRYTYIPAIGLFVIASWATGNLVIGGRVSPVIPAFLWLILLAACGIAADLRAEHWHDSLALWTQALTVDENNAVAHYGLANVLRRQNRLEEAEIHYRRALQLNPKDADSHNNLGLIFVQQERFDKAAKEFQKALAIDPRKAGTCQSLANVFWQQGDLQQALLWYTKATEVDPKVGKYWYDRAYVLEALHRPQEAVHDYENALTLDPQWLVTTNQWVWKTSTHRGASKIQLAWAVRLGETLCQSTRRQNADFLDTLAAAYAQAGRFEDARQAIGQALALVPDQRLNQWRPAMLRRQQLYAQNQSFHEDLSVRQKWDASS